MSKHDHNSMGQNAAINRPFLKKLRMLGFAEGVSTLLLFGVAMPLKYFAGMPLAVRIVGSAHGLLFVALVIMLMLAVKKVPMSTKLAMAGIIAAFVPLGPFVYDRWLAKREHS